MCFFAYSLALSYNYNIVCPLALLNEWGFFYAQRETMKYFEHREFACKCCSKYVMSDKLLSMLEQARHKANVPFIITSCYRCYAHNKAVGGVALSSHVKGLAVDIKCENSQQRMIMLRELMSAGFKRIGIHKHFIHVDVDTDKPSNLAWVYK